MSVEFKSRDGSPLSLRQQYVYSCFVKEFPNLVVPFYEDMAKYVSRSAKLKAWQQQILSDFSLDNQVLDFLGDTDFTGTDFIDSIKPLLKSLKDGRARLADETTKASVEFKNKVKVLYQNFRNENSLAFSNYVCLCTLLKEQHLPISTITAFLNIPRKTQAEKIEYSKKIQPVIRDMRASVYQSLKSGKITVNEVIDVIEGKEFLQLPRQS